MFGEPTMTQILTPNFIDEAIIALRENAGQIFTKTAQKYARPKEAASLAKFLKKSSSAFALFPPSPPRGTPRFIFSAFNPANPIPTGLSINGKKMVLLTNGNGDRLFGMGMTLNATNKTNTLQFFRMDYGAFNHANDLGANYDVWQASNPKFHFHIPKNT